MERREQLAALEKRVELIEKYLISNVSASFRLIERSGMVKPIPKPTDFPASGRVDGDVPKPRDHDTLEIEHGKETDLRVPGESGDREGKECSDL
jgi:hypothetical protein